MTIVFHCLIILSHCFYSSSKVNCDLRPWEEVCRSEVPDGNVTQSPQQMEYIIDDIGTQGLEDLTTVKTTIPLSGLFSKIENS